MVYSSGPENRQACKGLVGSNPTSSARKIVELFQEVKDNERDRKGLSKAPFLSQGLVF